MKQLVRKALVIDDDPGVRHYISELLLMEGFNVWEAPDGLIGYQKIQSINSLDLIVTDILMPHKDGVEVLMSLRTALKKPGMKPKIIAISGGGPHLNPATFLEDTKGLGADAILAKPFSIDDFRATLSSLGFEIRPLNPTDESITRN